jgi:tRNA-binding protein
MTITYAISRRSISVSAASHGPNPSPRRGSRRSSSGSISGPGLAKNARRRSFTRHYTPEGLVGRQVLGVVNFPPRQIGPVMSEVLVLGVPDEEGEVVLIGPGHDVPLGGKLF